jgi:hypothetical protein
VPTTIAEYRAEYAKADVLAIEVQSFRNKAAFPAIIELRNAGHHFLKAVDDGGAVVSQHDLDSALSHSRRACFEATEAGIMFALAIVKKFKGDYEAIVVTDVIPDYVARLRRCDDAMTAVDVGRRPGFDRSLDHQDRIDVFRELRAFCRDLDAGRDELNKKIASLRTGNRRFLLTVLLAIVAICVAVGIAVWDSTGYRSPWKTEANESGA